MDKEIYWNKPIEIVFRDGTRLSAWGWETRWGLWLVQPGAASHFSGQDVLVTSEGRPVGSSMDKEVELVRNVREPDITYMHRKVVYERAPGVGVHVQPIELTLTDGIPTAVRLMGPSEYEHAP